MRPFHKLQSDSEKRHKYRDLLKERRENWQSELPSNIEQAARSLENVVLTTVDDILGKKWIDTNRNKQWWDSEYQEAKDELQTTEKECKSSNGKWKTNSFKN